MDNADNNTVSLLYLPEDIHWIILSNLSDSTMMFLKNTNVFWYEKFANKSKICIDEIIKNGWINILQWAIDTESFTDITIILKKAVKYDQLKVVQWLRDNRLSIDYSMLLKFAEEYTSSNILKWLDSEGIILNTKLIAEKCIKNGNLEVLKWLINYDTYLKKRSTDWDIVKSIMQSLSEDFLENIASKSGHVETLNYLKEIGVNIDVNLIALNAVKNNNFEFLKWSHENGYILTRDLFFGAAKHNNLDMALWLKDNGCPCSLVNDFIGIRQHEIKYLEWLINNNILN